MEILRTWSIKLKGKRWDHICQFAVSELKMKLSCHKTNLVLKWNAERWSRWGCGGRKENVLQWPDLLPARILWSTESAYTKYVHNHLRMYSLYIKLNIASLSTFPFLKRIGKKIWNCGYRNVILFEFSPTTLKMQKFRSAYGPKFVLWCKDLLNLTSFRTVPRICRKMSVVCGRDDFQIVL